jgi:hypothetical protein
MRTLIHFTLFKILDRWFKDGGEFVNLKRRRPLPSRRFLVLISVRGWVDPRDILLLEALDQLKNPITSSFFD